ncbi:rhomboid protease GluP [archaeon BMS3Abin17]|nr:rhomboid protease GluP [archaeon BMS3Abin17]HDZ60620.1 rhomboid family intramembrane serine protease [Candidatus Pacearchaeota archaeon]
MVGVYRIYPKKRRSLLGNLSMNSTLILINIVAFVLFIILLSSNLITLDFVAIKPSNILQGAYLWTFLTSMFMHGGFFHIFANMLSLLFIGSLVEKILGSKRYLYFYLGAGLFAGLFFVLSSLIFVSDLNTFAVGASGALFGLVGLLMLLTPNLPVYIMFIPIPIKMKYAAPGILIVLWLISIAANIGIGNTAHLGGLIFGLIYGLYLKNKYKNKVRNINKMFS